MANKATFYSEKKKWGWNLTRTSLRLTFLKNSIQSPVKTFWYYGLSKKRHNKSPSNYKVVSCNYLLIPLFILHFHSFFFYLYFYFFAYLCKFYGERTFYIVSFGILSIFTRLWSYDFFYSNLICYTGHWPWFFEDQ